MAESTPVRLPDYHTHNRLCQHAESVPLDYAREAAARGVTELAATDHCPTDDGFGREHRMRLEEFPTYLDWVREAQAMAPIPVLLGVEADYYPGCERFLSGFLARHPFDVVLGSVHFLDYWARDPARRTLAHAPDAGALWRAYFAHIGSLADTGLYDVAAHLDLPKRFGNALAAAELREAALPALDRLAAAGMAVEINTSGLRHSPLACYPSLELLAWARERDIGLTFGSDAHAPERVGEGFAAALELAKAAGYREYRVYRGRRPEARPLPGC